jgi:hypothetical protein
VREDVAPSGDVTCIAGGLGRIPELATPEDIELVCGSSGRHGLSTPSRAGRNGTGGGGEFGGGGGGGDFNPPVFVYCV